MAKETNRGISMNEKRLRCCNIHFNRVTIRQRRLTMDECDDVSHWFSKKRNV